MFDRPQSGERALLVHVFFENKDEEALAELQTLATSAGADVIDIETTSRKAPDVKYYVGRGKVDDLKAIIIAQEIDVVIFNHALSPSQERNLEHHFRCRVLDRTGLILDIFAQRARTFEGKLQVELAQLQHLSTRLIRGWTHLERQKGGIGLRGPGEKQLETDRRLLRGRIQYIQRRLAKVRQQRLQGGISRRKSSLPVVALVGYTNAGKSSLFNKITGAEVLAEDKLFATLDPTLRKITLAGFGQVIFVDTVGFIRDLPHDLVEAFHATLEETRQADCLLHVIDISDPDREAKRQEVEQVLKKIGADDIPRIEVFNKIDATEGMSAHYQAQTQDHHARVWLSAITQAEFPELGEALKDQPLQQVVHYHLQIPPAHTRFKVQLFQAGAIQSETVTETGDFLVEISISEHELRKLAAGIDWQDWLVTPA